MSSINKLLLECPICFAIKPGHRHNCEAGHTICDNCRMRVQACPICNKPFANSRNYALESLIDSMSLNTERNGNGIKINSKIGNCPFKDDGCITLSENISCIKLHTKVCDFRTLYCGLDCMSECYKKPINYRDYFQHLKQRHEIDGVDEYIGVVTKTDFCELNDTDIKFKPFYIKYDDIIFFRRCEIINGIICWWFTLMGNEQLANKYNATIESHVEAKDSVSVNSKSKPIPSFKFRLPVHPFRKTSSEILQTGHYACMSVCQISAFSKTNNGLITTKMFISKLF